MLGGEEMGTRCGGGEEGGEGGEENGRRGEVGGDGGSEGGAVPSAMVRLAFGGALAMGELVAEGGSCAACDGER